MVLCTDNGKLRAIPESLPGNDRVQEPEANRHPFKKVALFDGMALIQLMGEPKGMKTCLELASELLHLLDQKTQDYDGVHLVFDRYDIQQYLKAATHERRSESNASVSYHVTDTTSIIIVTARQFLTSNQTKDELCT